MHNKIKDTRQNYIGDPWLPSKVATPFRGKEKFGELRELQALSLEKKIELSEEFISHLVVEHERPMVAWSGGRDSTVLLYLVLRQKPNIDVGWVNTGVEFPECMHFIRQLREEWEINLHIARPETTFWRLLKNMAGQCLVRGVVGIGGVEQLAWRRKAKES